MTAAVADVRLQQLPAAGADSTVGVTDPTSTTTTTSSSGSWQCIAPVFHTLSLGESVQLLQQVLDMHTRELQLKRDLLASFRQAGGGDGAAGGSGSSSRDSRASDPEVLRAQLTAGVTAWMVRPFVDDDVVEQLLQVLSDEMVGF